MHEKKGFTDFEGAAKKNSAEYKLELLESLFSCRLHANKTSILKTEHFTVC